VLFELISARYERRSMRLTNNAAERALRGIALRDASHGCLPAPTAVATGRRLMYTLIVTAS
jgi:hypothetical protein